MKKHAIIPIFIPHKGCPNACVFCNQKKITAKSEPFTEAQVYERMEAYLPTLQGRGIETIEVAFFGGSFTGIPLEEQRAYLKIAKEYKERGQIQKIHLSTRPDYINTEIMEHLKSYDVDTVELGVQSFDSEVLRLSNRGHSREIVFESAHLIQEYGFELGIQLMIGLPGDSRERCLKSVEETIRIKPEIARIYPTVVIKDTPLYKSWEAHEYQPFPEEETIEIAKEMYQSLTGEGIKVIRVGLKSSDLINEGAEALPGTYHPAFRQLVCGRIARETMEAELQKELRKERKIPWKKISFYCRGESISDMIGNKRENKRYFEEKYPEIRFRFERDDALSRGTYQCRGKE